MRVGVGVHSKAGGHGRHRWRDSGGRKAPGSGHSGQKGPEVGEPGAPPREAGGRGLSRGTMGVGAEPRQRDPEVIPEPPPNPGAVSREPIRLFLGRRWESL